jgi:hypothetical protein
MKRGHVKDATRTEWPRAIDNAIQALRWAINEEQLQIDVWADVSHALNTLEDIERPTYA